MIVSVSRRTDIPACYSEWFFNRLDAGFVYVTNPMNAKQVSEVRLNPDSVECFVFWTKDARPMMKNIHKLDGYNYYFQYTITGYGNDVEQNIHNKSEIIENFKELSQLIGKERMILRYDPIFLTKKYTIDYHCEAFRRLMEKLGDYTDKCVISFIDLYAKTIKNMNREDIRTRKFTQDEMREIAAKLLEIAKEYGVVIETCAEGIDLEGIEHGHCIDGKIIGKMLGFEIDGKLDGQREFCGCLKCVDIGQYNTCKNLCAYCYANYDKEKVIECARAHDSHSPYISGSGHPEAKITLRKEPKLKPLIKSQEKSVHKPKAEQGSLF